MVKRTGDQNEVGQPRQGADVAEAAAITDPVGRNSNTDAAGRAPGRKPGLSARRRAKTTRSGQRWRRSTGLAICLLAGLVVASTWSCSGDSRSAAPRPRAQVTISEDQAAANAAIEALGTTDLLALGPLLADHRGDADFAYFFASQTTPRALGDALASVAGTSEDAPLKPGSDPHAYDLVLTDLAGTLGLATFGSGDRALPPEWTDDFITATTTPGVLFGNAVSRSDHAGQRRADQDLANKQNLLLLLSRGYWSTPFLQVVTDAYWQYDHEKGGQAWPKTAPGNSRVAPAPGGHYLTDGMLALTAALTANPEASAWAFADFRPGTKKIDGSKFAVGKFTHYLLFEHRFPEAPDGERVGMTATLTALSSAIDATSGVVDAREASTTSTSPDEVGPLHDSLVLQDLAEELSDDRDCSWNPRDYWNCALVVADVVWSWVQDWGHLVLEILSFATFVPPPFTAIGVAAAATNATWYAIDGDYVAAGLSLATAMPGLAFGKISKSAKAAAPAQRAAAQADDIAKAATKVRKVVSTGSNMARKISPDDLRYRPNLSATTKRQVLANAKRTPGGHFIDANSGKVIRGPHDFGHKPGYEWRCIKAKALAQSWTRQELIDNFNNPAHLQIEDPASNRGHRYESATCAR